MAVTATITAADTFTDWIAPRQRLAFGGPNLGELNLSVWGASWSGTVTLQRTFNEGTTILDVEEYTANVERIVQDTEAGVKYRIGVVSTDSIAGTVNVRLA